MDQIMSVMDKQAERIAFAEEVDQRYREENRIRKEQKAMERELRRQKLWQRTACIGCLLHLLLAVGLIVIGAYGMAATCGLVAVWLIIINRDCKRAALLLERALRMYGRRAA